MLQNKSNKSQLISILLIIQLSDCQLIIDQNQIWTDDFAYYPTDGTGWNIRKRSGFDLTVTNPLVAIDNKPEYHGPFPAQYALERDIQCNTEGQTQLFVSLRTHYCNTDRKSDSIQVNVFDPSETYDGKTFTDYRLNQLDTLLDRNHLLYVQQTTEDYYTNDSSSTTDIPQCAQTVSTSVTTTGPIQSHLIPGEWYSTKNHKTYDLLIVGGHTYTVAIEMLLSGDTDEYVLISDIFMECRRTYVPTIGPTLDPTTDPTTALPTQTPTNTPTETSLAPSTSPTPALTTSLPTTSPIATVDIVVTESMTIAQAIASPSESWCYHCALYVIIICVFLVFCFLILMFVACVMYRREAKKQGKKHLQAHMSKYKARQIPKYQNNHKEHMSIDMSQNKASQTESTKYTKTETLETKTENENENDCEIESDVNIINYSEMDSSEKHNPLHQKTVNYASDHQVTERNYDSSDVINEEESDDILGINGVNGNNIITEENGDFENENESEESAVKDRRMSNASYDHLNMDEMDACDKSDSPYF